MDGSCPRTRPSRMEGLLKSQQFNVCNRNVASRVDWKIRGEIGLLPLDSVATVGSVAATNWHNGPPQDTHRLVQLIAITISITTSNRVKFRLDSRRTEVVLKSVPASTNGRYKTPRLCRGIPGPCFPWYSIWGNCSKKTLSHCTCRAELFLSS